MHYSDFVSRVDNRGKLVVVEFGRDGAVPFEVRRIYFIYGAGPGVSRGFHAHRNLEQLAFTVSGHCRVRLDDGRNSEDVWLNSPSSGLRIEKMVWHEMHDFSEDCVLMVLASDHYDESDYIRDYKEFQTLADC